eukprot:PhF_6_TR19069/c0_g1_i1/m.28034
MFKDIVLVSLLAIIVGYFVKYADNFVPQQTPEQLERRRNFAKMNDPKTIATLQIYEGTYVGETIDGAAFGKGAWKDESNVCEGIFVNNDMEGAGTCWFQDSTVYEGNFEQNEMSGHGTLYLPDGGVYRGDFRKSKREGYGEYTWPDARVKYAGNWVLGLRQGQGIQYAVKGERYEGEFLGDYKHGKGKTISENGTVKEVGYYEKNEYKGPFKSAPVPTEKWDRFGIINVVGSHFEQVVYSDSHDVMIFFCNVKVPSCRTFAPMFQEFAIAVRDAKQGQKLYLMRFDNDANELPEGTGIDVSVAPALYALPTGSRTFVPMNLVVGTTNIRDITKFANNVFVNSHIDLPFERRD